MAGREGGKGGGVDALSTVDRLMWRESGDRGGEGRKERRRVRAVDGEWYCTVSGTARLTLFVCVFVCK